MTTAHSEKRQFATVLQEIAEDVERAADHPRFHPSDTVVASDQVIGVITNPATKQIFFARQKIQEELMNLDDYATRIIATMKPRARVMGFSSIEKALSTPEFGEEAKELKGIRMEAFFAHAKYEALNHLLWMSVKRDLSEALFELDGRILLKKGWKVVQTQDCAATSFPSVLELFGEDEDSRPTKHDSHSHPHRHDGPFEGHHH